MRYVNLYIAGALLALVACSSKSQTDSPVADSVDSVAVAFDADSAYAFVEAQTAFGPRVPGSNAHAACAEWLDSRLRAYGCTVVRQKATVNDMDGQPMPIDNIVAQINPEVAPRMLLVAHYDTRPWADEDNDPANHTKPIDGANDGASGVAVILEVVRQISLNHPDVGVDILFTDLEDSGKSAPEGADSATQELYDATWCRGTQYFVDNFPIETANIRHAILLDMVGGRDAVFAKEYFSNVAAANVQSSIWAAARSAGHGDRFVNSIGGAINDDHLPLIRVGIPTVDIIEIGHPQTGSFNPTWHTLDDNLQNIDRATLGAVGATVLTHLTSTTR